MPVFPALWKQRQEQELISLDYLVWSPRKSLDSPFLCPFSLSQKVGISIFLAWYLSVGQLDKTVHTDWFYHKKGLISASFTVMDPQKELSCQGLLDSLNYETLFSIVYGHWKWNYKDPHSRQVTNLGIKWEGQCFKDSISFTAENQHVVTSEGGQASNFEY